MTNPEAGVYFNTGPRQGISSDGVIQLMIIAGCLIGSIILGLFGVVASVLVVAIIAAL